MEARPAQYPTGNQMVDDIIEIWSKNIGITPERMLNYVYSINDALRDGGEPA